MASQNFLFTIGDHVRNFVIPSFDLFKEDSFAPLVAFLMVCLTASFLLGFFVLQVRPAIKSLGRIRRLLSEYSTEQSFTENFVKIDQTLSKDKILNHGWEEFKETLIHPQFSGASDADKLLSDQERMVIRNTRRPFEYINIYAAELGGLKLNWIHAASNYFIGFGLLFTFIGLVAALHFANQGVVDADIDAMQSSIAGLLQAASFKFWTSVAGLGCSIFLNIGYSIGISMVESALEKIGASLERGVRFITPETIAFYQLREAEKQTVSIANLDTDIAMALAPKIEEALSNAIGSGVGDAVGQIAAAEISNLKNAISDLPSSLDAMKDSLTGSMSHVVNEMSTTVTALNEASTENMSRVNEAVEKISASISGAEDILKNGLQKASEDAGENIKAAYAGFTDSLAGVSNSVNQSVGSMNDQIQALSSSITNIEENLEGYIDALKSISSEAGNTERAMVRTSELLAQASAPLVTAGETINQATTSMTQSVESVSSAIQQTQDKIGQVSDTLSSTLETLEGAWSSYNDRFESVDADLAEALRRVMEGAQANIDNMNDFVGKMDGHLETALNRLSGNVEELSGVASELEKATNNFKEAS